MFGMSLTEPQINALSRIDEDHSLGMWRSEKVRRQIPPQIRQNFARVMLGRAVDKGQHPPMRSPNAIFHLNLHAHF